MRKSVVLTSVKTLVWPFAASTLGPKQSDKMMGLCYSLDPCVKLEGGQERDTAERPILGA